MRSLWVHQECITPFVAPYTPSVLLRFLNTLDIFKVEGKNYCLKSFLSSYYCMCVHAHHVQLFVTPWIIACQASLSTVFSRHGYWSGLSFPTPGDLPNPGIKPVSPVSPSMASRFFITVPPGKLSSYYWLYKYKLHIIISRTVIQLEKPANINP